LINAWIINSCDNKWIINSFYFAYRSPIRSDYKRTVSIQSKMYIFVLKSEQIRSDSDQICTPLIPNLPILVHTINIRHIISFDLYCLISHINMVIPQNRYQTRRDTPMCFDWRKTSEIFYVLWCHPGVHTALCTYVWPMKNFCVHSRMASYDGIFSRQHS
jgi:hypothetical protein